MMSANAGQDIMPSDVFTPYAGILAGLTLALALAAPLAAERGGAHTKSLRDLAAPVLTPGALVGPERRTD
jgi:hypothetical protein